MKVIHIAFECAPIFKTGGLGDVVGSLPIALKLIGVDTAVMLPGYGWINREVQLPGSTVPVYYAESPFFKTRNVTHDQAVQAPKYAHFALMALAFLKSRDVRPDIIHCHDWHAGLIPFLLKRLPDPFFHQTKTLLTIHNSGYQGEFPVSYLNTPETKHLIGLFANLGKTISYLRLGISSADYISTVSENHAREIKTGISDFGLKKIVNSKADRFWGILNGIDYTVWNPKIDKNLALPFSSSQVTEAKKINKKALQVELGLREAGHIPLFGMIARISQQKGIDLVLPLLEKVQDKQMQIVILGTGDKEYEDLLKNYNTDVYKPWIKVTLGFDETLAHKIYGAADFFLIPSHYEPCGLTQMIAMRYGSLPIGSPVGGLKDSIRNEKDGFLLSEVTPSAFETAIDRAISIWENLPELANLRRNAMKTNFSWTRSALKYLDLYHTMLA